MMKAAWLRALALVALLALPAQAQEGNLPALSLWGRSANTSGQAAAIAAGADHNLLRRNGTAIGFGSVNLAQSGAVGTSILAVPNGGTGLAVGTSGGVPYFNSTTTIASSGLLAANGILLGGGAGAAPTATAACASAQILIGQAGAPTCNTVSGDVTISAAGVTAIGANKVLDTMLRDSVALSVIGRSANSTGDPADIACGTDGNILRRSGTTLACGSVDLAAAGAVGVTILAGANGGTGNAFFAVTGPATSLKTFTFPNASATVLTNNAAVTVAQGGTGIASGTSGGIPYFSASTTIASSAALAANQLVIGGGAGVTPATLGSLGTTAQVLHGNAAGAPSFGAIVSADVTDGTIVNADLANMANATLKCRTTAGTGVPEDCTAAQAAAILGTNVKSTEPFVVAASDEITALTTGAAKVTWRMPYAFTVTGVRCSLTTAQASGSIFTVDINEGGTTIISTKVTIDNTEETSTTAVAAPVISDSSLADDAEMTVDIDQIGTSGAAGLKCSLIGNRT